MDFSSFVLEISSAAKRDLKKLPPEVQKQIVFHHLPIIEKDPFGVGSPLIGALKGERSYHWIFCNLKSLVRKPDSSEVFLSGGKRLCRMGICYD